MTNPNTVAVWSPDGKEMVETSRLNAYDLVTHANWSYSAPRYVQLDAGETPPAPAAAPVVETPAAPEPEAETEAEETAEEEAGDEGNDDDASEEAPAVRKTEEDFADLTDRADVVAYLAEAFPDFKPHHLTKRDGLVAKAIELANA